MDGPCAHEQQPDSTNSRRRQRIAQSQQNCEAQYERTSGSKLEQRGQRRKADGQQHSILIALSQVSICLPRLRRTDPRRQKF